MWISCLLSCIFTMCHKSPSKVLRNVMRITKYLEKKVDTLSKTVLPQLNIAPNSIPLSFTQPTITNISPVKKCLYVTKLVSVSISPLPARPRNFLFHILAVLISCQIFQPLSQRCPPRDHPYIVEASRLMYGKHPDDLTPEE